MDELIFLMEDAPEGGYTARATGSIYLYRSGYDAVQLAAALESKYRDAVRCHFDEGQGAQCGSDFTVRTTQTFIKSSLR